ncbi:MAG: ABC transporter ATP-binding protein [Candidatus Poseidoniia archaeon]|jgi:putative ABC transport system ATP-binding protein|nr:ABC transporter ATP-binding protein [Candidatus Poseidoniia archaeon]MDP6659091.1 ABC transporter ATP-binding protein [Candidatus Poseidoniia archaeon]MDP6846223.1 ABC transporter ATP-binding protein [Candidatus Poseidoniia archaeon]MDP7007559.1 ABC transporter ATP-binding protein [Candidatus Poseidoniia archaeon]|tara:strand:- start:2534 stop:3307 length:774 start_codon:yes stop_codon:yes gene_type:complete
MSLLELEQVSRIYETGGERIHALDDFSLTVEQGAIVLLVGPSGSGKTTLLNVISALDAPTSGSYHFGGELVPHDDVEEMTAFRRRNVGYVFQFFNLLGDLTALENILLVQELTDGRDEPRARELLALVGLTGLEERFPSEMSGGQQQRVAIARSLAKSPRLLLGDEPTGNLDSETTRQVMEVLVDACRAEKITAVLVTHDHALERYATRVIAIDSGKLVEDRPGELATVKGAVKEAGRSSKKALKLLAEKARRLSQV